MGTICSITTLSPPRYEISDSERRVIEDENETRAAELIYDYWMSGKNKQKWYADKFGQGYLFKEENGD